MHLFLVSFSQNNESLYKPTLLISCFMIGCAGGTGPMKDSDKLKLMLLAWNYHNNQGKHSFTNTHTTYIIRGLFGKCTIIYAP